MYSRNKQQGFTLIELVVIIVILGVLAATAASKFINVNSDANIAILESVGGTLLSGAKLVYGKSITQGLQTEVSTNIELDDSTNIDIKYGYPTANRATGIANTVELGDDWAYGDTFGGGAFFLTRSSLAGFSGITNNNIPITRTNCFLTYIAPVAEGLLPTVTYNTDDC